jgi:hypothetical protein
MKQAELTTSGGLQTDVSRALGVQGDGYAVPDSSFGIYEASTNKLINGGFETNTTGWLATSTNTIASSAEQAKFGSKSCKVVSNNTAVFANIMERSTTVTHTATSWVVSAWIYIPSSWSGTGVFRILITGLTSVVTDETITANMALRDQWQRIYTRYTPNAGDLSGAAFRLSCTSSAEMIAGEFFYLDGIQTENTTVPTPYIETDGAEASRVVGSIEAPSGLIHRDQFWVAMRLRMEWDSTVPPFDGSSADTLSGLFSWEDSNTNRVTMDYTAGAFRIFRRDGGSTGTANNIVTGFDIGDYVTVIGYVTATRQGISVNGSAFNDVAATAAKVIAANTFRFGDMRFTNGKELDSSIMWAAVGRGTCIDTDAAKLYALGTTDPTQADFADTMALTMLWTCDDEDTLVGVYGDKTYKVLVDWENNGAEGGKSDFSFVGDDITGDVFQCEMTRGRDYASQIVGRSQAGSFSANLDNRDSKYSPFNADSPLYGLLLPGRPLQVRAGATELMSAAKFVAASSQYYLAGDVGATPDLGNIAFDAVYWVFLDSLPTAGNNMGLLSKRDGSGKGILLYLNNTAGTIRFHWNVQDTAGTTTTDVTATTFGTPETDTWYMIHVYHDPTGNVIGIAVNNGTADTAATSGGLFDGAGELVLGAVYQGGASAFLNGKIQEVGIWTHATTLLTADELTWLYNDGNGRHASTIGLDGDDGAGLVANLFDWFSFEYNVTPLNGNLSGFSFNGLLAPINAPTTDFGTPTLILHMLWAGVLAGIQPTVQAGPFLTATLKASGPLSYPVLAAHNVTAIAGPTYDPIVGLLEAALPGSPVSIGNVSEADIVGDASAFDSGTNKDLEALRQLEDTEGGFVLEEYDAAIGFKGGGGFVSVQGRVARLQGERLLSQATFSDQTNPPFGYVGIVEGDLLQSIFNYVAVGAGLSQDATSIAKYGQRNLDVGTTFFANALDEQAFCDYVISLYKDPIPILSVDLVPSKGNGLLTQALVRQLSDRVTVIAANNTGLGISQDFYVEAIRHKLSHGTKLHETSFDLSPAQSYVYWVLDTSILGETTRPYW